MSRPELLTAAVTVRHCTPADQPALLALHRAGFVNQWDEAFWRWRFVDNPLRRTELTGAFAGERCLASFAGVPLPCRFRGESGRVHACGDVVVLPELRRGLAGSRVLLRTGELYFKGFGDPDTRLVLGWPEPPLRRMLVRHLGCEVLGDLLFLVRDLAAGPAATAPLAVTTDRRLPDDLEGLWQQCAAEWTSGLVRDRPYLDWRYVRHPRVRYAVLCARAADGALRGLAVAREGGYHPEVYSLVDWLVPRADHDAAASLVAEAGQLACAHGRPLLLAMFASSGPEFLRFQEVHGFRVRPLPHQAVFRSYAAGIDRQFLFDHWYLTMGDLDFT